MKNKIAFFLLVTFISSCSTQPPNEAEIKNLVKQWYDQQSTGDGAGRWEVEGVTVLSIDKDTERKNVFKTVSIASGTRISGLPPGQWEEPKADRKFSDTLRMDLRWNGAKWVTAD